MRRIEASKTYVNGCLLWEASDVTCISGGVLDAFLCERRERQGQGERRGEEDDHFSVLIFSLRAIGNVCEAIKVKYLSLNRTYLFCVSILKLLCCWLSLLRVPGEKGVVGWRERLQDVAGVGVGEGGHLGFWRRWEGAGIVHLEWGWLAGGGW